ncbi:MAG: carbonic anhydrase [Planctomycetota bacterium]|nr:carbonic anhydrase [Planctomycetota bacterium]MDE1888876.1 carbonic anhydrase [Planctomycetota bacterium]MDE2215633.1 carbonic anhydrase [Planctomycetota bacterium]
MEVGNIFRHLLVHNEAFVKSTESTKFLAYATQQNPYITLLTCADSRVQGNILGIDIFNKIFIIRNAGNQVAINRGTVEYSILVLHTPVMLVLGHTDCGAVKFATHACITQSKEIVAMSKSFDKLINADYSTISREVKGEMLPLTIPIERGIPQLSKFGDEKKGLAYLSQINVDYQIEKTLKYYGDLVKENKLTIIGGVYDFVGAYSKELGRILITNINGNISPNGLQESARTIIKRIPNYDESSQAYKTVCQLIEEKVTRI